MKKKLLLLISHAVAGFIGFAAGIYLLPILTAPSGPSAAEMASLAGAALYQGEFRRDLKDSDFLHWGEGPVMIGREKISLDGRLAPGPDYKLYLSPAFVETEADFQQLKPQMARVGDIKTFDNFIITIPEGISPEEYNSVIIWCETFAQFITAAKYR